MADTLQAMLDRINKKPEEEKPAEGVQTSAPTDIVGVDEAPDPLLIPPKDAPVESPKEETPLSEMVVETAVTEPIEEAIETGKVVAHDAGRVIDETKFVDAHHVPEKGTNGLILVHKLHTKGIPGGGSEILKEDISEDMIEVRSVPVSVPICKVSYGGSITVNLGNYESAKISITCELPSFLEELPDAYHSAKKFVDTRLAEEVTSVRAFRDKKKKD